ncbi:hypothetical protein MYK68_15935 [Gordonia sp. PP30]|uniref:hypothetical protein n=1 Tax=Gordonia sp. PP30 TaxID=2935861 RepID=UPI001FFE5FD3|nr:hypothetical protein [Gordonia sp. PP30]UQE74201.1 hypothetical protein MYK68_15935 [Gordonia sp. PP30]
MMRILVMVLAVAGAVSVVAGSAVLWSVGVALLVAGVLAMAVAGLLYDPKVRE